MNGTRLVAIGQQWLGDWMEQRAALRSIEMPAALRAKLPERKSVAPTIGGDGIAQIDISGPLTNGRDDYYDWFGIPYTMYGEVADASARALGDPNVRGVLFNFDSPGGECQGLDAVANQIAALSQAKPTAAFTRSVCGSAAYYLASQTGRISNTIDAYVGSIGTVGMVFDVTDRMQRLFGVKTEIFRSGPLKFAGSGLEPLSDAQRQMFQDEINHFAGLFGAAVKRGRGKDDAWLATVTDGAAWIGSQAVARGVSDGVESIDQARAALAGRLPQTEPSKTAALNQERTMETSTSVAKPTADTAVAPAAATQTAQPGPTVPAAKTAATLAELKEGCPGSSAEFRESCMERGLTLEASRSEWTTQVVAANEKLRSENATLKAASASAAEPPPIQGGKALSFGGGGAAGDSGGASDAAAEEFAKSAELQAEFGSVEAYTKFNEAQAAGLVRYAPRTARVA